jgi:hypothetical protein
MSIVNSCSNRFKAAVLGSEINFLTDDFKLAMMDSSFAFNKRLHSTWADISSHEIAAGHGYTAGGTSLILSGEVIQDDILDKGILSFNPVEWIASGEALPDIGSGIIYNNTHVSKIVVGCSDFDVNYSTAVDKKIRFTSIQIPLA